MGGAAYLNIFLLEITTCSHGESETADKVNQLNRTQSETQSTQKGHLSHRMASDKIMSTNTKSITCYQQCVGIWLWEQLTRQYKDTWFPVWSFVPSFSQIIALKNHRLIQSDDTRYVIYTSAYTRSTLQVGANEVLETAVHDYELLMVLHSAKDCSDELQQQRP